MPPILIQNCTRSPESWIVFRHEEKAKRIDAVKQPPRLARALGEDRTREELIPFMSEFLSDEKDVLLHVADELSRALPLVGGPKHVEVVLLPLEELANVDEGAVKEAASSAIVKVCAQLEDVHVQQFVVPLFMRLSSGFVRISASYDWYSSKLASCSLLPAILPRMDP